MNKKIIGAVIALVVLVGCGEKQDDAIEQEVVQPSNDAVTYNCEGETVKVDFNNSVEPQTADLFIQGSKMTVTNVEAASGAKYSDGDITFWTHQGEAILSMESTGNSINCVEESLETSTDVIVDANGNTVTEGCKTWFDGCNTCQVGESGMPMACTRKFCAPEIMSPAKCIDEDSISEEKQACNNAGGVWNEEQNACFEDPSTMAGEGEN